MKKFLIAIVLFLFFGVGCSAKHNKVSKIVPITIGAIIPLTGSGADQGEWIKRGLELALDKINQKENIRINLQIQDSVGDTKNAISVYNNLKLHYRMPAIITWGSSVALALTPLVNQDHIIQMGVATAVPSYSTPNDYTFRNFPSATLESFYLSDVLKNKLNVDQVAILKINNDYGISSAASFEQNYNKLGGSVIVEETFEPNINDFRTTLTKLKKYNPKFIYISSYPKEGGLILRQAKELNINSQFIASVAILGGKEFFDNAGEKAEGLVVVTSAPIFENNSYAPMKEFTLAYKKRYHEEPGAQQLYSVRAYDALMLIAQALNICDVVNGECVKNELFRVKSYNGAGGVISFDNNGDSSAIFNLQIIKDGRFVEYK